MTLLNSIEDSSPAEGPCAWLLHLSSSQTSKNLFPLEESLTIGRSGECQITLPHDDVSPMHAEIIRNGSDSVLVDLASNNGTYANRSRIFQHILSDGDYVRVGSSLFKFLSGTSLELTYHQRLQRRVVRDGLTGAYNKSFMLEFLERELGRCCMHDRPLSVLMMDIDFFKQINDTYGHLAGDDVLCELVERVMPMLDADDIFARYGGEEFSVVMCENDLQDALQLAEDIRARVGENPFSTCQGMLDVTLSIGISEVSGTEPQAPPPKALVERADQMLYHAKQNGRNRVSARTSEDVAAALQ